jgi:hypothetical protein
MHEQRHELPFVVGRTVKQRLNLWHRSSGMSEHDRHAAFVNGT